MAKKKRYKIFIGHDPDLMELVWVALEKVGAVINQFSRRSVVAPKWIATSKATDIWIRMDRGGDFTIAPEFSAEYLDLAIVLGPTHKLKLILNKEE